MGQEAYLHGEDTGDYAIVCIPTQLVGINLVGRRDLLTDRIDVVQSRHGGLPDNQACSCAETV